MGLWVLVWAFGPVGYPVSFLGPTALFGFIYLKAWIRREDYLPREGRSKRVGALFACGMTALLAIDTLFTYLSMDDAPRGLLWDINILAAPLAGMTVMYVIKTVLNPSSILKRA